MKIKINTGILNEPNIAVESETGETPKQVAEAYLKVVEALKKK